MEFWEQILFQPGPYTIPTSGLVVTPTPDPTANWKTYTNTKYGFEIKYPTNYFISTTVNRIELAHNKWKDQVVHHPFVSVEVFETKSSIDEWVGREIKEKREDGYGVFEEVCDMHCVSATAKEIRIGGNIRALQYSV